MSISQIFADVILVVIAPVVAILLLQHDDETHKDEFPKVWRKK